MSKIEEIQKLKKIRIINILSGDTIILKNTINMTSDTLKSLYYKISNELNKVNISNMIINKYVYTRKEYLNGSNSNLKDTCLNRSISSKVPRIYYNLSKLFDEYYDEDYIEVSLMFGSCIPHIIGILNNFQAEINMYNMLYNRDNNDKVADLIKSNNNNYLISSLSKLDNNCLLLDDYYLIVSYINNNINLKYINNNIQLDMEWREFLLNEINKKFFTIN